MYFFSLDILSYVALLALAITSHNSFWHASQTFPSCFKKAAQSFKKSSAAISVSQQIQAAFQDKFSQIPDIIKEDYSLYESQIALPLCDIITNNVLCMFSNTFSHIWTLLYIFTF